MRYCPMLHFPAPKIGGKGQQGLRSETRRISWLWTEPLGKVPESLRSSAAELRSAVKNDDLTEIAIWYVHNCKERKNVAAEMATVEHAASNAMHQNNSIEFRFGS